MPNYSGSWTLQQQMQALAASNWPFGGPFNYIEDVFSTFLYNGNSSSQNIANGIDLAGKGGMVWIKGRSYAGFNNLTDTVRGPTQNLFSNTTNGNVTANPGEDFASFNSNGFSLGSGNQTNTNDNAQTFVSWTFREQEKFFDVVTYTGNEIERTISHNLGSVPGMIIVKRTDSTGDWWVYHRSLGADKYLRLNTTNAQTTSTTIWNNTSPTSSVFSLGGAIATNISGATYVAYLFAHDAGGFGLTGTDNVISCGSFTTDGSGNATVNLGYEPQYLMFKASSATGNWFVVDVMREWSIVSQNVLRPNLSDAEFATLWGNPTATGFIFDRNNLAPSTTFIYMAIRRPMKVPTTGTSVYQANTYTGNATANTTVAGNFGFPVDLMLLSSRSADSTGWSSYAQLTTDRLRGADRILATAATTAESTGWTTYQSFSVPNNIGWGLYGTSSGTGYLNNSGGTFVARGFKRAPGFFDEVCYTGTGSATTQAHNLGVVPELIIVKRRSATEDWAVYSAPVGNTSRVELNTTSALTTSIANWNDTSPTTSVFSIGTSIIVNGSGSTYVAYLFATCAGVSKVGSYTGTGATQTINCGFTGGARFVMIKRTDSTGNWWIWDTVRGMVSGTDPRLALNSSAAELNNDWVFTTTGGFQIVTTDATVNASGGSYIFLAIA
jgi:hypothetical protein